MKKTLEVTNNIDELERIRSELLSFIANTLDPLEKNRVVLSVDEAVANVIEHANDDVDVNTKVTLVMEKTKNAFIFTLEDEYEVFDPTSRVTVNLDEHADKGLDRGLGIYLYTMLMETSHEKKEGGGNRLILIKRFEKR